MLLVLAARKLRMRLLRPRRHFLLGLVCCSKIALLKGLMSINEKGESSIKVASPWKEPEGRDLFLVACAFDALQ